MCKIFEDCCDTRGRRTDTRKNITQMTHTSRAFGIVELFWGNYGIVELWNYAIIWNDGNSGNCKNYTNCRNYRIVELWTEGGKKEGGTDARTEEGFFFFFFLFLKDITAPRQRGLSRKVVSREEDRKRA